MPNVFMCDNVSSIFFGIKYMTDKGKGKQNNQFTAKSPINYTKQCRLYGYFDCHEILETSISIGPTCTVTCTDNNS